ncbi:MAG: DUF2786 domain-containing protein [Alphaproteobacteria bacterium]|nr:DUF2786 domain-containing protein [Alphaproteobacteria bacterium]
MRPQHAAIDDIDADYEILEAIGQHVDDMIERHAPNRVVHKTLRRWLMGHAELPEGEGAQVCLMTMAADLELFTPSASGRTAVDRLLNKTRPETPVERRALDALGAAQFRLVRIARREGQDVVHLTDLVTGESLRLLEARIALEAAGLPTAMRLCPLASGRHVLISPLFALDEATLAAAMKFARPGRPLGHRCAANLYRDVARRGFLPIPQRLVELDAAMLVDAIGELEDHLTEVERLALRWIAAGGAEETNDLVLEARQLASVDNLIDACGLYGQADPDAPAGLKVAFERIAGLQMETIAQRARVGVSGQADGLDAAAAAIANYVAQGAMETSARDLFQRLRTRWTHSAPTGPAASASAAADLERVIQRIQALRAKTVDRGCTQEEAMAAAAKVAELLDRHDLTLDAVSVRGSDCQGVGVTTDRKRRAPVDSCMQPLARFCDCRVWSEESADGMLRYVFFGMKADVEAARFLHDLIEITFETESTTFRHGDIYRTLRGGDRRVALNSFQVGLASGIAAKLAALKAARQGSVPKSTGFDLVAAKHAVVDEEIARLGLNFTSRATTARRFVHGGAYAAGKAAGALFEPTAVLTS